MMSAPEESRAHGVPEVLSASRAVYACYKYGVALALVGYAVPTAFIIELPRLVLLVWLLIAAVAFRYGSQFKQVALLDSCLVITSGKRSTHVPIGNVVSVSQSWTWNPQYVLIVLGAESSFGRRIKFLPARPITFPPWVALAVVRRLRRLSLEHPHVSCTHGS
jgi:hypothetical protein